MDDVKSSDQMVHFIKSFRFSVFIDDIDDIMDAFVTKFDYSSDVVDNTITLKIKFMDCEREVISASGHKYILS